jgi:hypothetical protein
VDGDSVIGICVAVAVAFGGRSSRNFKVLFHSTNQRRVGSLASRTHWSHQQSRELSSIGLHVSHMCMRIRQYNLQDDCSSWAVEDAADGTELPRIMYCMMLAHWGFLHFSASDMATQATIKNDPFDGAGAWKG